MQVKVNSAKAYFKDIIVPDEDKLPGLLTIANKYATRHQRINTLPNEGIVYRFFFDNRRAKRSFRLETKEYLVGEYSSFFVEYPSSTLGLVARLGYMQDYAKLNKATKSFGKWPLGKAFIIFKATFRTSYQRNCFENLCQQVKPQHLAT
ncbi:MAG: hypothetical protein FWC79_00705 [Oscillospiraceae bacterium]|nr:hypothetical protein [Oscillospiraceae bacterium]